MRKNFRFRSKNLEIEIRPNQNRETVRNTIQIKLVNFENRFAYALLDYVKRYKQFRYSIYIFFAEAYQNALMLKTNPQLVFSMDDANHHILLLEYACMGYLWKSIEEAKLDLKKYGSSRLHLDITFVNLKENDQIIRAWYAKIRYMKIILH